MAFGGALSMRSPIKIAAPLPGDLADG